VAGLKGCALFVLQRVAFPKRRSLYIYCLINIVQILGGSNPVLEGRIYIVLQ